MARKKQRAQGSVIILEKRNFLWSLVYKELSGNALKLYCILAANPKRSLRDGAYEDDIKLPYSLLVQDTGLSIQTVNNCIIELEHKGLIDLIERGGLKSGGKSCSIYRLSIRFLAYGTADFEPGTMKHLKGLRTHCGFAAVHKKQKAPMKSRADTLQKLELSAENY